MPWEVVLIGANEDLESIPKQFISVNELLRLFARFEKVTIEQSAQWLFNNINILNKSKKLVLKDSYTLIEYQYNDNDFYNCPIETIKLIASGEDSDSFNDYVGFGRYQLLKDLKGMGLDIDDNLVGCAYVSKFCYENDDNFYKNQCIYLIEDINQKSKNQKTLPKTDEIHYLYLLDKNNPSYSGRAALLLRIIHDLITLERFDEKKPNHPKPTKQERVADCLEEYGKNYGIQNTPTNAIHFANLIHTREKSKSAAIKVMSEILNSK